MRKSTWKQLLINSFRKAGLTLCVIFALCWILFWIWTISYLNTKNASTGDFTPKTAASSTVLGVQELKLALYEESLEQGLTFRQFARLKKIVACESSWDAYAYNGRTKDHGLFQINGVHLAETREMGLDVVNNPLDNIEFGVWLYKEQNSSPWQSSKRCWGM